MVQGQGSGESPSPSLQTPSHGREQREARVSVSPLVRPLTPTVRAPHLRPEHPSRAPSPHAITFGCRISTYDFGGDTNIQSLTPGTSRFYWILFTQFYWVLVRNLPVMFRKHLKHDLCHRLGRWRFGSQRRKKMGSNPSRWEGPCLGYTGGASICVIVGWEFLINSLLPTLFTARILTAQPRLVS